MAGLGLKGSRREWELEHVSSQEITEEIYRIDKGELQE